MTLIHYLLRKKRFMLSVSFLTILLVLSFANTIFNDGKISQVLYTKHADGTVEYSPPYAPFEVFWFGSDRYGYSITHKTIEGAKYTIGIVLIITSLRMLISLFFSYFAYSLKPLFYKAMKSVFEPFTIIPQVFISYFILFSVLSMVKELFLYPFWERALFEIFILTVIAIPNLTVQLSHEMRIMHREPFVEAAIVLGGRKRHLFFKHIVPNLYDKWILTFSHQFLQVLLVLAHLGLFELFFGGTITKDGEVVIEKDPPRSLTNEWSGLLGDGVSHFYAQQWMVLVPLVFYTLTALSVALMNDSFKSAFAERGNKPTKMKEDKPVTQQMIAKDVNPFDQIHIN